MQRQIRLTVEAVLVLIILGVGFYPALSNAWNQYVASRSITWYERQEEADQSGQWKERELAEAEEYNEMLAGRKGSFHTDRLLNGEVSYESILNPEGSGIMGYLEIPEIGVSLPIFHGTGDEVLEKGVGHYAGSSFPVGGSSTHAVLTGHRGLPAARLFTDLDRLGKGSIFTIHVPGRELTYSVTEIRTILPHETESLAIREGQDLVTLVTCTPYGINSHRLLVTGERIVDGNGEPDSGVPGMKAQDWNGNSASAGENEFPETAGKRFRDLLQKGMNRLRQPECVLAAVCLVLAAFLFRVWWIWTVDRERERVRRKKLERKRIRKEGLHEEIGMDNSSACGSGGRQPGGRSLRRGPICAEQREALQTAGTGADCRGSRDRSHPDHLCLR